MTNYLAFTNQTIAGGNTIVIATGVVSAGDRIVQAFDLASGNDVTSDYMPLAPNSGYVVQCAGMGTGLTLLYMQRTGS